MEKNKLNIGIIGAGASGLVSAWLLDQHHQITIFEKEDRLGGHVCTIPITTNGKTIHVEAGVEFFSDMMFPQFNRLLQILKVPTRKYPLTYTFYHTHDNKKVSLPPIHDGAVSWQSLNPHALFDLTQLNHFISAGTNIMATEDIGITLSDFADTLMLTQEFKEHFLYPFFGASWGVSPEDMKNFAAYDIIKWARVNEPAHIAAAEWNEIVGGMSSYINALVAQLRQTTIIRSANIIDIAYANNQYIITQADGQRHYFDHLIIATNAVTAKELLKNVGHAEYLRATLGLVEYFYTTIAIHGDRRFMPVDEADWSVVNIRYDGINSALTICKPWMREAGVFRSWITYPIGVPPENPMPHPLYDLRHFYHPIVNYGYFAAQRELASLQGNHNLWIAGFYTHDADSHNNAIVSAISIAKKLAPGSGRLRALTT